MRATVLDGAMGTALIARGLEAGALPEEWLRERPEEIARVHTAHAAAGAELVLTCTFNLAAPRLEARLGAFDPRPLARAAVALARRAAPGARVAGALGPTGLFGPGRAPPPAEEVRARYAAAAAALAAAGADLLWLESQWDLAEARAALAAALRAAAMVAVSFTGFLDGEGPPRLPDETPLLDALAAVAADGAAIVGVNCVPAGETLADLVRQAGARFRTPLALKPSPGLPGAVLAPDRFAAALEPAIRAGARYAGGCCGATGAHVGAVAALVRAQGSADARG
ncbi:MAG TPA: homocysteine S-methyltransferase family protein [Anaeromyxobacteraceae bacterium]|nr:homocysteine S-methyltransferase family protein [Anaeromyxobacteraceae bacterium]